MKQFPSRGDSGTCRGTSSDVIKFKVRRHPQKSWLFQMHAERPPTQRLRRAGMAHSVKLPVHATGQAKLKAQCLRTFCLILIKNLKTDWNRHQFPFKVLDPFDGAKPRLSRRGRKAPLRVNPERAPAFMLGSRRVDSASPKCNTMYDL
jgi:hypothetical protein